MMKKWLSLIFYNPFKTIYFNETAEFFFEVKKFKIQSRS